MSAGCRLAMAWLDGMQHFHDDFRVYKSDSEKGGYEVLVFFAERAEFRDAHIFRG